MPYIESDGTLQQSRPYGISMVIDLFWGTINFVNSFYRSLFQLDRDGPARSSQGGSGPNAPGGGGRRMGGMRRFGGVPPPPPPCAGGCCG